MRDRLSQAIASAQRYNRFVALLFIDLDRFKQVNDKYGHKAGDGLLVMAAKRMTSVLRANDTLFRQGGDEFVAVLPNIKHPSSGAFIAGRLVNEVSKPYAILGHTG